MVKLLKTLNAQWSTRVRSDGVGASENPMQLKRKHTSHTNILKSSSGLYKS